MQKSNNYYVLYAAPPIVEEITKAIMERAKEILDVEEVKELENEIINAENKNK